MAPRRGLSGCQYPQTRCCGWSEQSSLAPSHLLSLDGFCLASPAQGAFTFRSLPSADQRSAGTDIGWTIRHQIRSRATASMSTSSACSGRSQLSRGPNWCHPIDCAMGACDRERRSVPKTASVINTSAGYAHQPTQGCPSASASGTRLGDRSKAAAIDQGKRNSTSPHPRPVA